MTEQGGIWPCAFDSLIFFLLRLRVGCEGVQVLPAHDLIYNWN